MQVELNAIRRVLWCRPPPVATVAEQRDAQESSVHADLVHDPCVHGHLKECPVNPTEISPGGVPSATMWRVFTPLNNHTSLTTTVMGNRTVRLVDVPNW
jgi:hypothetical protein